MSEIAITGTGEREYVLGPVLLLGAPGVGKGTQAQRLGSRYHVPQISTGDLLRNHVQLRTDLGVAAKQLMDIGKLVPDGIVNGMVAERLRHPDTQNGYILDGFPRTEAQSAWLDGELQLSASRQPLLAVQIQVPLTELLHRITGRRICQRCQHIYNIYSHSPKVDGICDVDGSPLQHRSDDTEEAFHKRMVEYEVKTSSVIEHYRHQQRFREINGNGSIDEVEDNVLKALRLLRSGGQQTS